MATRRRDPGGSWWWATGGAAAAAAQPAAATFVAPENERRRHEVAALRGYPLREVAPREAADSGVFQLSYPRPRLRWTAELHDQFVKAVDELGGADKATPKGIMSLMGVQGITLYHLKSHLQKFRLGKTGRRLWKKDLLPPTYGRKRDDRILPPTILEAAQGPFISNAFNRNGSNVLGAEAYENLHRLIEPPAAPEKFEAAAPKSALITKEAASASAAAAIGGVKLEEDSGDAQPPLLPLFPAAGMMEWSEYLDGGGGGRKSADNATTMDDYLSYSSPELAGHHSRIVFKSFFDEVATFSAAGADHAGGDYP